jgi:hypothetical protein
MDKIDVLKNEIIGLKLLITEKEKEIEFSISKVFV